MAIQKDLNHRMQELERGLRALQLSHNHYLNTRDDAYLLTIQAQLRALVVSGGPGMTPLLLDLSHKTGVPLYLYVDPNMVVRPSEKRRVAVIVGKTWNPKMALNLQQCELSSWLRKPAYSMNSTQDMRSREQIIKHISNKEGGAHYDDRIVTIVDFLSRTQAGSEGNMFNGVQMFLLDMGALLFWVGTRMGLIWNCRQKGISEKLDQRIIDLDNQFSALQIVMQTTIWELTEP